MIAVIRPDVYRRCTALALALGAAACGQGEAARTSAADSTRGLRVNPATASGSAILELWQLRPAVSLGDWRSAHPDEAVSGADTSGPLRFFGDWCAMAQRRWQLGEREISRTALFYPPDAGSLSLPDSVPDLVRQCRLGLVWVTINVPDSAAGARLADSVRSQLAEAFGRLVSGPVSFYGSAYWSQVGRFRRESVTAVAALRNPPANAGDSATSRRSVVAFAYLPNAGVGTGDDTPSHAGPWTPSDSMPLDSAVALSGIDLGLWAPLAARLRVAETGRQGSAVTAAATDSLARALRRWLGASAGQSLPRRAAALYVADVVLERALCATIRCDARETAALEPLRALGAQFAWEPLGASWVYARTWLNQARVLDRDSPLGQRILLAQMARAFDFSGTCAAGEEGFRRVIENGTRYLDRVPNSPIAADVHYLVGEAYRDVVALAHGAGDIYADSSRYSAEQASALANAQLHYRAAMRAGAASAAARAAWRQAWWMKAGLVPRETRFYCVYD